MPSIFGKCGPIFEIISPGYSYENSVCMDHKHFHLIRSILLDYLVKFENPKMLTNFYTERDNMFN